MNLEEIRELIALMRTNQIAELEIDGEHVRIVSVQAPAPAPVYAAAPPPPAPIQAAAPPAQRAIEPPPAATAGADTAPSGKTINSPIVGTFYASPGPDAAAFVRVGDTIDEETVLCIVEAMKVMNEIKAEAKGEIVEILVENGQPVEFGQPLFRIIPAA